VIACERGEAGIYNITDDEPATVAQWLPAYAEALGAKRPWKVPGFIGRLLGGTAARMTVGLRGASNAKARSELGWEPRYRSWREGFPQALG
jgi:nucleoside-diphosphate-sugar epimerase